jgi:hypothetical protein
MARLTSMELDRWVDGERRSEHRKADVEGVDRWVDGERRLSIARLTSMKIVVDLVGLRPAS